MTHLKGRLFKLKFWDRYNHHTNVLYAKLFSILFLICLEYPPFIHKLTLHMSFANTLGQTNKPTKALINSIFYTGRILRLKLYLLSKIFQQYQLLLSIVQWHIFPMYDQNDRIFWSFLLISYFSMSNSSYQNLLIE